MILFAYHPARNTFETIDQRRYGNLWRVIDQQVNMIIFAIELNEFRLKVSANAGENLVQFIQYVFGKDITPIFCDKDQVYMKIKNTVSSCAYFCFIFHRPIV